MLLGAIAYDDGRFDYAMAEFQRGLERMDYDLAHEYGDLFELLAYGERFRYEEALDPKRAVIERVYWIDRDPDPTTAINERRLEHFYRMFIADLYFSCFRPPIRGWRTERGAAIVKFGWPWNIERTLGDSWHSGRIERWYYVQRGKLRQFVFEDEYLSGNLRIPIYADSMVVVLRYGPRSSSYRTEAVSLPGAMDVAVFKDDEFSSTVYLAAMVDADSLRDTVNMGDVDYFYFRGAFFDGEWAADHRFADTLWTSEVPLASEGRARFYHIGRSVSLPFDSYHVACAFEDQFGTARALFKDTGDSFRFVKAELAVSDILFLSPPENRVLSFSRNGKALYPNPGRDYKNEQRLAVYFEVYGLGLTQRRTDYDVTFHIYEAREKLPSPWARFGRRLVDLAGFGDDRDPAVSQTIRRRGISHTAAEEMLINVDALDPGRYELAISIVDRISDETTHISAEFSKIGGGDR
jgi:GWxTD domain-containing protein